MIRVLSNTSLVLDVYAPIVRLDGGWIAIADLIAVLADLDREEQAVRSSVSRLVGKRILAREERDGAVGYALTPSALEILDEGDCRIYGSLAPATLKDGWVVLTFSVPEDQRSARHRLRRRLTWLGFGNLSGGLWIAPRRVLGRTMAAVTDMAMAEYVDVFTATYQAFDDPDRLVARCWDIERMREGYAAYIEQFEPGLDRWSTADPAADPKAAFADFIAMAHAWRQLPYLDPGLPPELLPPGWEGTAAAEIFDGLNGLLLTSARAHVSAARQST